MCGWVENGYFYLRFIVPYHMNIIAQLHYPLHVAKFENDAYPASEIAKGNTWIERAKLGETDFRDCDNCPVRFLCYCNNITDIS